ncbi:MAG TPA: thiamine phosphate synthase [Acidisphaera sp.]|nr:thiamine phosphate synthase [Acidisphaera sp.]
MDARLVSWARAVKARQSRLGRHHPVLWLFTDAARLSDPLPAIARLPRFLSGVVFRHDGVPGRAELGRQVAVLCRRRGIALSVAGDERLAARLHAGTHVRGRHPQRRAGPALTGSAHTVAELRQLAQRSVPVVFLSPAFATASHPQAAVLGVVRWSGLARSQAGAAVLALGGIDNGSARRLPRWCSGVGAIGALS